MTKTVKLSKPITHDGKDYAELTLREMELGDMLEMEKADGLMAQNAIAISLTAGVPIEVVRKIRASDYRKVMKEAGDLLGNDEADRAGES